MSEFDTLDRCAGYVAARAVLLAITRAVEHWPVHLAEEARHAAIDTMMITAEALGYVHGSAGRRRCVRDAITSALAVAGTIDIARALGFADDDLDHAQRTASRAVALLGMFLHANAAPVGDEGTVDTAAPTFR